MAHPFQDRLFAFIGKPERCKTSEARDALDAVGGVFDDRIKSFTDYVVEFRHNGQTDKYKRAVSDDKNGYLVLIDEVQFFDILEGRAEPPPKKENLKEGIPVFLELDQEGEDRYERARQDIINRKRLDNLAKYGVPMPDGSRVKADLRLLDKANRAIEIMKGREGEAMQGTVGLSERCDKCASLVKVHLSGIGDGRLKLCLDCYNRLMADMTGTDFFDELPKRLSYKGRGDKTHNFDIELLILPLGKSLTATEIGKTKRKVDVWAEVDDDVDEMLETLKKRIKKALSVVYMDKDGYVSKNKAVGYIEFNRERDDHDVVIDGKPYTWEELKKNISAHEGWKIKIEFGSVGDELD